jgi:hypothetical protein
MLHLKGQAPPFEVGELLGQMSPEYAEWEILAFYCGGCKQVVVVNYAKIKKPFFKYAMKLRHRQTGEIRYVVKCRGCWERVDSPLDFNQFKVTFCSCFVYTLFFYRLWSMRTALRRGNRCCWKEHIYSPTGRVDKSQREAKKGDILHFLTYVLSLLFQALFHNI